MRRLLLFIMLFPLALYAQEDYKLTGYAVYVDSAQSVASTRQQQSRSLQPLRKQMWQDSIVVSSRRGTIKATYDATDVYMLDGMVRCLRMAMDIWEECMDIGNPVRFHVCFRDDLSPEVEIMTKVGYRISDGQTQSKPFSLYNQSSSYQACRDTMFVNANIDWDYGWDFDLLTDGYDNLITTFLRHIGHILGFGSSITELNGQLNYAIKSTPSVFDCLVSDAQNNRLGSLGRKANTTSILSFLTRSLHLALPTGNYDMFSSSEYVPYRSGMYFSLAEDNLMNYPYGDKTKLHPINKETLDALQAIGWSQMKPHDVTITGTNMDVAGYGSYYASHTFCAADSAGNILSNVVWKYQLYHSSSSQYVDVATGSGGSFTINSTGADDDTIDDNSCLQGRVVCSVTRNGVTKEYTKPVFWEMRPQLNSFEVLNVNMSSTTNYFSFDVKIVHAGTVTGELTVCNEYGQATSYPINSSGTTVIHVSNALKYGMTYFDLTLSNAYGENVKILYYNDLVDASGSDCSISNGHDSADYGQAAVSIQRAENGLCTIASPQSMKNVVIADVAGRIHGQYHNLKSIEVALPSGLYILQITQQGARRTYQIGIK